MSDLTDQQAAAIATLQALGATWHKFHNGTKAETVTTDAGEIPTLAGLANTVLEAMGGVLLPKVRIVAAAGTALALDVDAASRITAFDITLNRPSCVLSLLNAVVPAGYQGAVTLTLRQGTGANLVTWPSSVLWQYNRAPVLSYKQGAFDMITLVSDPVTNKWRGLVDGGWFNV